MSFYELEIYEMLNYLLIFYFVSASTYYFVDIICKVVFIIEFLLKLILLELLFSAWSQHHNPFLEYIHSKIYNIVLNLFTILFLILLSSTVSSTPSVLSIFCNNLFANQIWNVGLCKIRHVFEFNMQFMFTESR